MCVCVTVWSVVKSIQSVCDWMVSGLDLTLVKHQTYSMWWLVVPMLMLWFYSPEYAGNIGDAKDKVAREAEQDRILALVDKF